MRHLLTILGSLSLAGAAFCAGPIKVYTLTIRMEKVHPAGKEVMGITVNGGIPGPTLRFTEGDSAVIHVTNAMDMETSVHWHGLLLPNFQDGVPYLTTPPIKPGGTFTYGFPLKQSGTYWYHAHTMLQEQSGVYGSIVIDPKTPSKDYDSDLVLVLSDWTNEKPMSVMRNLRRGNEWYGVKKGTSTPLAKVIGEGAFGAQLNFWRQRMQGADLADIYYDAFLINGEQAPTYPVLKPGERVRVRVINAAASSQFWLTFGGAPPMLIAADGLDVVPVPHATTFIAIAETYDFIVTIPQSGRIEMKASVQDGSGTVSALLGNGPVLAAADVPKPDKVKMMEEMAGMKMRMGAPAMKFHPGNEDAQRMKDNWGMKMDAMGGMDHGMDHGSMKMHHGMDMAPAGPPADTIHMHDMPGMEMPMDTSMMGMPGMEHSMHHSSSATTDMGKDTDMDMAGMDMNAAYNYDELRSPTSTAFPADLPRRDILLNLTGNMWRYIWSLNGVPLSEADLIPIKKGEVIRLTLNNLTMMHHPMHLHGHFFRVLNANGDHSPLKHTVNVAPMQQVTIEFEPDVEGDWFFHCHVLYHMMSGMARVFTQEQERDPRMAAFPRSKVIKEANHPIQWGLLDAMSDHASLQLVSTNVRNKLMFAGEYGWNQRMEGELTYERYLYDYLSVFVGANAENEEGGTLDDAQLTGMAGIRFFTPYMFNLDFRVDNQLRPRISLEREVMVLRGLLLFGKVEYRIDPGAVNDLELLGPTAMQRGYAQEWKWNAGAEYLLSRCLSIKAGYDSRFGGGAGLSWKF